MYNILIALAVAVAVFAVVTAIFGWVAGVVPALIAFGIAWWLLSRRVAAKIQPEMDAVIAILQDRKIDEGRARLLKLKQEWGPWQIMLSQQIDSQIGMLDYIQLKFDEAMPFLVAGSWRNWAALVCIGAIHWRKGNKAEAWKHFGKAADAAPKEAMAFVVWATLLEKDGQREEALKVVGRGLEGNPQSEMLKGLQASIANKKKVDTQAFGQTWLQFFPEEMIQQQQQQMLVKGRRDQPPLMPGALVGPKGLNYPMPKPNRKMRRGR